MEHQNDHLEPLRDRGRAQHNLRGSAASHGGERQKSSYQPERDRRGCLLYDFIISTKLATSAIAIMMQYTAPVYVAVLARIF